MKQSFDHSMGMFKFMDKCENNRRMVKTSFSFIASNCKVSVYSLERLIIIFITEPLVKPE